MSHFHLSLQPTVLSQHDLTEAYLTLGHIGFNSEPPIWYKDPHLPSLSSSSSEHFTFFFTENQIQALLSFPQSSTKAGLPPSLPQIPPQMSSQFLMVAGTQERNTE